MINCPVPLGRVPGNLHDPLLIKATQTGIVLMQYKTPDGEQRERKFKARYSGSKKHAVDINGKLWLDVNEMKAASEADYKRFKGMPAGKDPKGKGKKKGSHPCDPTKTSSNNELQSSETLTTPPKKAARKKEYSVNKREVRQRILGYINSMHGAKELYFWTVSFPEGTPDNTCYQAFNTWLTSLRKHKLLKEYIWVAERQDGKRNNYAHATGTIHFHIAIPHKMPVQRANSMMRGTLKNLAKQGLLPGGICPMGAKGKTIIFSNSVTKYNGVDLCKHKKTGRVVNFAVKKGSRALSQYLSKYVTKNDAVFTHLCWHNSRGFSSLFTGVTFSIPEFINYGFPGFLNKVRRFDLPFCVFIPWLMGPPPLLQDHLYKLNSFIQTLSNE